MAEHVIEYDAECTACNATGIYVGMGECDGAGVVCSRCGGTGKVHRTIKYKDFDAKVRRKDIKRVFKTNPGIGIGDGENKTHGKFTLKDFGGMPYEDWFKDKPFPPKSEMRKFSCPAWWYQCADYSKKPNWDECIGCGAFSDCKNFKDKEKCWERFDEEN